MKEWKSSNRLSINKNVFNNSVFSNDCYYNTFGYNCYSNTFKSGCYNNTFENFCYHNTLESYCNHNIFKDSCFRNTLNVFCSSNTFEKSCNNNTLEYSCSNNIFGYESSHNTVEYQSSYNTFEYNIHNRKLENGNNNTVISLSEEFYDDGSGQLIPIKHPDLSTQPSILPYKFMGQYVYEQLIPFVDGYISPSSMLYLKNSMLSVNNPIFLNCEIIVTDRNGSLEEILLEYGYISKTDFTDFDFYITATYVNFEKQKGYVKITYTSMPEEDAYY